MDWKKALKMVVGIPETAKGASELGSIPVGTEGEVELPAGKVKISYSEAVDPPTENDRMIFPAPEGLEVSVSPQSGGDPLPMKAPTGSMIGKSPGPVAWRTIGTVEVPAAGTYTVVSAPALPDRADPRIFLGR